MLLTKYLCRSGRNSSYSQQTTAVVLLFGMFQVVLSSTIPSGLYALYEQAWHLSRVQTTIIFSMYVVGVLLSLFFLGGIADRYGRRPAILLSVGLAVVSSLIFLCATHPLILYAGRLFSGLSVGICTGAFTAALRDTLGRVRGAALSAVITSGALAVGPLASAVVAAVFPLPLRLPFAVHAAVLVLVFITCFGLPRGEQTAAHISGNSHGQGKLFPSARHLALFISCATVIGWAYGANGMWQSVVPLSGGLGGVQLRIATVTAVMLAASAVAQLLTMSRQAEKMIIPGLIILGLGLALTAFAVEHQRQWLLWLATCVVGAGQGAAFRSSLFVAAESATAQRQAKAISLYYVFGYVMTAVMPLLSNVWGVPTVLYTMTGLCVASIILIVTTKR